MIPAHFLGAVPASAPAVTIEEEWETEDEQEPLGVGRQHQRGSPTGTTTAPGKPTPIQLWCPDCEVSWRRLGLRRGFRCFACNRPGQLMPSGTSLAASANMYHRPSSADDIIYAKEVATRGWGLTTEQANALQREAIRRQEDT
jgi:hypothetical protein